MKYAIDADRYDGPRKLDDVSSLDQLKQFVRFRRGTFVCQLWRIRDICGEKVLKPNPREEIRKKLAAKGLLHWPPEISGEGLSNIRIIDVDSPVGKIYQDIQMVDEATHKAATTNLRDAQDNQAAEAIQAIRDILNDQ